MKNRKPFSFILMCIVFALILIGVLPGFFMRASETPSWYGGLMIISFLLILLLPPIALIMSLLYKSEDVKNKSRNNIGKWSSLAVILLLIGAILYGIFIHDSSPGMWG